MATPILNNTMKKVGAGDGDG